MMRKLEIRDQKRSQGFSVQPLDRVDLQKAGINLSDASLHQKSKKSNQRIVKRKNAKEDKETLSAKEVASPSTQSLASDELCSRVLDRYQVMQLLRYIQAFIRKMKLSMYH